MIKIRPMAFYTLVFICTLFAAGAVLAGGGSTSTDNKAEGFQKVLDDVAAQVVSQLPDDIHFRLLAIGPIEGDDGGLARSLTVRIKNSTNYHLIERQDLNRLLEEQGVQLSPISDDRRPVTPGKIKGVEGLLMGKITAKHDTPFYYSIDVYLKLDNVEGGDIVFAQQFSARYIPTLTHYLAGALGFLILVLFCANRIKKTKKGRARKLVQKDSGNLFDLQTDIKQAKDKLNRVHDQLVASGELDLCSPVLAVRDDLADLEARIDRTPAISSSTVEKGAKKSVKHHGGSMKRLIKNITVESANVDKAVKSSQVQELLGALDKLKTEVALATEQFQNRPVGKS